MLINSIAMNAEKMIMSMSYLFAIFATGTAVILIAIIRHWIEFRKAIGFFFFLKIYFFFQFNFKDLQILFRRNSGSVI